MKRILAAIFVLLCSFTASAQETITHQINDDGFAEVPLQFAFPYYGQYFTNSWMYDNGVVGFYSPFNGYNGGQNYFSQPFSTGMGGQFSYMIAPLWTDLANYSGTFTTQGDSTFQRYNWNNISQWGYPDRLNTFSLEITPSGSINFQYDQVSISGYPVSVGMTGDVSQGEFEQLFYAASGNTITTNDLTGWDTYTETNMCSMDVLSSPECPGYEQAYFDQQCSSDPLYDNGCAGYAQAYFDQQCSSDPLYDNGCAGYEVAYFNQQCSSDPLYDNGCAGYEVAYFNQQCSVSALYDSACPGYAVAFLNQQQPFSAETVETVETVENTSTPDPADEIDIVEVAQESLTDTTEMESSTSIAEVAQESSTDTTEMEPESETKSESTISASTLALVLSIIQNQNSVPDSQQASTNSADSVTEIDQMQSEAMASIVDNFDSATEQTDVLITEETELSTVDLVSDVAVNDPNVNVDISLINPTLNDNMGSEITTDIDQVSVIEIAAAEPVFAVDNTNTDSGSFFDFNFEISELENSVSVAEVGPESTTESSTDANNIESMLSTDPLIVQQVVVDQQTDVLIQADLQSSEAEQEYLAEVASNTAESVAVVSNNDTRSTFENNTMQQVLALGGSITQILNTVVPDFSRFEIKPPTEQEQFQASRVENTMAGMSDAELEMQIADRIGDMDPAAQTILLQIMAYSPGFDQYGGTLTDQSNWYQSRGVYTNNRVPNTARSSLMFGAEDQRHQELMSLQYRR